MKTAMTELIDKIKNSYDLANGDIEWQKGYRNGMTYIKLLATELLEKEKEQHRKTFIAGRKYENQVIDSCTFPNYYNQTYNL